MLSNDSFLKLVRHSLDFYNRKFRIKRVKVARTLGLIEYNGEVEIIHELIEKQKTEPKPNIILMFLADSIYALF